MLFNPGFESRRIFTVKLWLILLIVFCLATIIVVFSGIMEYKSFQEEKKVFLEFERNNVKKYQNYDQYGGYGFRVYYEGPSINLFFNNSNVFDNLYSNIDMTEIIKIHSSYKGRNLFLKKGMFKDMSGLFFIFGTLIMTFMGLTAYRHEKYFFRVGNVLLRMTILDAVFIALLLFLNLFPGIFGINISHRLEFLLFGIFSIIFLNFFYAAGYFIRSLKMKGRLSVIIAFAFWFFSIAIITESVSLFIQKKSKSLPHNETYNLAILDEVMTFERHCEKTFVEKGVKTLSERRLLQRGLVKEFLSNGYLKNIKRENEINSGVERIVREYETYSSYYPTTFYLYTSGEISGKGYLGYLDFTQYIFGLRIDYVKFYIKKKFYSDDKTVESFVKSDENVFKSEARLPANFLKGLLLTVLYTFVLFLGAYLIHIRRLKKKKETLDPKLDLEEGEMKYLLCENEDYMDKIFHYYEQREDVACIDNVNGEDIDPGTNLYHTAIYFCRMLNARLDRTFWHIEKLGIENLKKEKRTPEAVKKIFCAAAMAIEKDTIVFREFIRNESRDFERKFLALLKETMDMDRTIIYLGTDILLVDSPKLTGDKKVSKYREYDINDPREFILR